MVSSPIYSTNETLSSCWGTRYSAYDAINDYVQYKINDSLTKMLPIHEYHLERWGYERANELGIDYFKASKSWITGIEKRGDLVSRKLTDLASRPDRENKKSIEDSIEDFLENYRAVAQYFPHYRILYVDQSGHKYEISNLRSLTRRGTRDHVLAIDSVNKNRHSYTIQPIMSRDGRLRGKLLVCFHESKDEFGVDVEKKVEKLEKELGNLVVVPSKSGMMSRNLSLRFIDEVLVPEIARLSADDSESMSSQDSQSTKLAGPSWASNPPESWTPEQHRIMELRNADSGPRRPRVLLLLDSWEGHASDSLVQLLDDRNIFVLRIPPRTTSILQPLDVQIFRQYKWFIKRIMEATAYEGISRNLTDRYGIMRMQSLIWNQLQAPVYRDMALWGWRHTD